jgi:O-succinylbenzoic acid--CoA ligase
MQNFLDIESGSFQLNRIVDKFGESPAIVTIEGVLRYREFFRRVSHAAALNVQQVQPGDRVAIIGPNSGDYLILLTALWQVGAVTVPVSTRFPKEQYVSLLEKAGCRKLIRLSTLAEPQNPQPNTRCAVLDSGFLNIPHPESQISYLHAARSFGGIPLNRDATLIFTSGSSGEPKAALHTFGNHIYSALGSNLNIPFRPGDRWLLPLPLYHVGGLAILFRALVSGGAVAVPGENMSLPEAIRKLEITHVSLVATQLDRLLKEDKSGEIFSSLKAILLGGSAIPPPLIRAAIERGLPIHTSYGSTEMGSQITTTPPGAPGEKLLTSGKVLKHREIKIAPDGEILVRGKTRFRGYWEGNSLKQPFDEQRWFPTGDMGRFDADRYLIVIGRKDNMFISGGENIQPEEIETTLCQLPEVEQAVVVPVESEEFGVRPAAFINMQTGKPINEAAIRRFLEKRIARFKIPDCFFAWPEAAPETGIKPDRKYFQQYAQVRTDGKILK